MTRTSHDPSHTTRISPAMQELHARGLWHQCTDPDFFDRHPGGTFYLGFDATARSLHVGHLLPLMAARCLQRHGFRPLILVGGGTTRIGDPSFRDEARRLMSEDAIHEAVTALSNQLGLLMDFRPGPSGALLVNNAEWLLSLRYINFLRDFGRHFSVSRMLSMDSVRQRLERESGLSFLEFNYMLLQAYDFYHLAEHYQCLLQLGGSDQWGNMVMGVDLVRRLLQKEAVGLTVPLLTTSSGKKMGKTAQGAIWLDSTLCTPYDYWQYWRNTEDADTGRFLRALTDLSVQEIERLEREYEGHPNELKKVLATECTALVHGREAALEASERAKQRFESDEAETSATIHRIDDCPPEGIEAYRLLQLLGWVTSGGEARKAIRSGQVRLDGAVVTDECHRILPAMFAREGGALVQWGKKKIVRCLATLIV